MFYSVNTHNHLPFPVQIEPLSRPADAYSAMGTRSAGWGPALRVWASSQRPKLQPSTPPPKHRSLHSMSLAGPWPAASRPPGSSQRPHRLQAPASPPPSRQPSSACVKKARADRAPHRGSMRYLFNCLTIFMPAYLRSGAAVGGVAAKKYQEDMWSSNSTISAVDMLLESSFLCKAWTARCSFIFGGSK